MCLSEPVIDKPLSTISLRLQLTIRCSLPTKALTKERRRLNYASSATKSAKRMLINLDWISKWRNFFACCRYITKRLRRSDRNMLLSATCELRLFNKV